MILDVNLQVKGLLLYIYLSEIQFCLRFPSLLSVNILCTTTISSGLALSCTLLIRLFHTEHYSTQVWIEQQ